MHISSALVGAMCHCGALVGATLYRYLCWVGLIPKVPMFCRSFMLDLPLNLNLEKLLNTNEKPPENVTPWNGLIYKITSTNIKA